MSNGRKFSNPVFARDIFRCGLNKLTISLISASSEEHDMATCCYGSFAETLAGIKNCSVVGSVSSLTTITKNNYHHLLDIVRLTQKLGVEKSVFNCAIPVVSEKGVFADQCLSPKELGETVTSLFRKARVANLSFHLNATFPICLIDKDVLNEMIALKWISVGCHMYEGEGAVFDTNGSILPCTHFSDAPLINNVRGRNGNFFLKNDFLKEWNNPDSVPFEFRKDLWRYPVEKCMKCKYWGTCIGGCPLLWTHFDPATFIQ